VTRAEFAGDCTLGSGSYILSGMQPAARATATEPAPHACAAAWVATAAPGVRRYLRCLRCPRDLVDDVVQDALLAAVASHGEREPPLPWLLTVAKNRWLELCRRQRPELIASLDALDLRARRELGDDGGDARVAALRACVQRLPARSQQALRLCYGEVSVARTDVAARLGLGIEGLRSLLARLRAALKQCIERRRERDA